MGAYNVAPYWTVFDKNAGLGENTFLWHNLANVGVLYHAKQSNLQVRLNMAGQTRRVLLVEDDGMISLMLRDMIEELGFTVIGPVYNLADGLARAGSEDFDFAVLDYRLGDRADSRPIAELLSGRGIPFAFATAYGRGGISEAYADVPVIDKPVLPEELERVLAA
jgi:CheY-like chemotaxis protein